MNLTDKGMKLENKDYNRDSIPKFVHYDPSEHQSESVRFSVREDQSSQQGEQHSFAEMVMKANSVHSSVRNEPQALDALNDSKLSGDLDDQLIYNQIVEEQKVKK